VVEWVERAAEMWKALGEARWDVVFVDVSLPDASGRAHLQALAGQREAPDRDFALVALTRDAGEEQVALASGIERTLRKPFAPGVLDRMARELPAPRRPA
jgi:CheY-like chemotaxis protein